MRSFSEVVFAWKMAVLPDRDKPYVGVGLARDAGDPVVLTDRSEAIAGKPTPTDVVRPEPAGNATPSFFQKACRR